MESYFLYAAFGAMLLWGIADFLIQKTVRKIGDVESLGMIGIIGSIVLLLFVVSDLNSLDAWDILYFFAIGAFTFAIGLVNFEALKRGKLGVMDVILTIELPVTIFLGLVFLSEVVSLQQLIVMCSVFVGVLLISIKSYSHNPFKRFEKGMLFALIAAIGYGLIDYFTAISSRAFSPLLAIWAPWTVFTALCAIIVFQRKGFHKIGRDIKRFKGLLLIVGLVDVGAWIFYALALSGEDLAITTAITEGYPAIALFLGRYFNKELIKRHQYFGAVLALVAAVTLALLI